MLPLHSVSASRPTSLANSFIRAPLLAGALTSIWAGTINYPLHHLGMGGTIGQGVQLAMNNRIQNTYLPVRSATFGGDGFNAYVGLLGDPTLVENIIAPAGPLTLTKTSTNKIKFDWIASTEPGVSWYSIYKITATAITKVGTISGTSWTSDIAHIPNEKYMVRAVKLETTTSGSYWNQSMGSIKSTN